MTGGAFDSARATLRSSVGAEYLWVKRSCDSASNEEEFRKYLHRFEHAWERSGEEDLYSVFLQHELEIRV